VTEVISPAEQLIICATSRSGQAACPTCHEASQRVHSYYQRSPRDLPVSGQAVQLRLQVRRFRCLNTQCPKQTFAEPLPDLIAPIARRTNRLTVLLGVYAIQSGGEPGARLLKAGGVATSPDTLLRLAKVERGEPQAVPRVIGVADFAFRRGHTYGAIIVDLLTHRPVDLLVDRSAETFARRLSSHPGVEWISPDRSKEFARGARLGAPQAQQILDRWHVLMNLREVVERALNRLHPRLSRLSKEPESPVPPLRQRRTSTERARTEGARQRRLALYEQVVELYKQGGGMEANC
jgi:transposase